MSNRPRPGSVLAEISGVSISESLAAEAKGASPAVKAALIEVLATRRATDELPAFVAATVDDNAQVRSAAMAALGQIGRPQEIAAMCRACSRLSKGGERDAAEKNVRWFACESKMKISVQTR